MTPAVLLFALFFSGRAYAQRVVEEVLKKEEPAKHADTRIDMGHKARSQRCGGRGKPLAVVGMLYYPPFSWKELDIPEMQKDRAQPRYVLNGYAVDYFNHILDKIFKKVFHDRRIIVSTEDEIAKSMRRGSADIHVDSFYTGDPVSGLEFIYPAYISNPLVPIIRKNDDTTKIEKTGDLKNYKGAVILEENIGWIYRSIGIDIGDSGLVTIKSGEEAAKEAFSDLLSGNVDYVLTGLYFFEAEAGRYKVFDRIKVASTLQIENGMFMAISKMAADCLNFTKHFEREIEAVNTNPDSMRMISEMMYKNIDRYIEIHRDEPRLEVPEPEASKPVETPTDNTVNIQ